MKILVLNYSFDASEKKITFTDYNPIVIERVLLITNITDNVIIYNFADPAKGGTAATNVLTLTYDTASMSDTDKLQIFYDDVATAQPISGTATVTQGTATNLKTQAEAYQGGAAVAVGNPLEVKLPAATVTTLTPPAAITGFATAAKQLADGHTVALSATDNAVLDTIDAVLDTINAKLVTGTVIGDVNLGAVDNAVLDTIAAKDFATQTTLAALNAKMVTGTDIGDVTINNSTGAAAVNIQDGGNTITVDGTVAVTNADITSCKTALELLDNSVDGNYLNTNINIAGVDVSSGAGAVGTGVQRITHASDDPVTTALQIIDNCISGNEAQVDIITMPAVVLGAGTAEIGKLAAGTAAIGKLAANSGVDIGDVDILSIAAGDNNIGNVDIVTLPGDNLDIFRSIDLDESEEDIKGTAGKIYGYYIFNAHTATLFVKFYNATAANTTVGTTTPIMTIPIPAGAAANCSFPQGIGFSTALCAACTTGVADADTGAPAANVLIMNAFYK